MAISDKIRARIIETGASFVSNDNISAFMKPGDKEKLVDEVEKKMRGILQSLVIDIEKDHNTRETARRVAKMWVNEVFSGRYDPAPDVTSFPNVGYNNLYTCGPISIRSTCAHHFQNIVGRCWVGVLPNEKVIGLSKFNRIVHHISERPQIQEEMTTQIADALVNFAETPNIAVVIKAEHHCMTHRGVREHESDMTTAVMRGCFLEDKSIKNEFYQILNLKQK
jgi:GTP cyclohydrolase I